MEYIIGIDLGTTNCAMAFAEVAQGAATRVRDFPIPQLQRAGEVAALPLLPSCLYVPNEHELAPDATRLPWGESSRWIVGAFARWQGARVPGRLVASAKSWLSHTGVDRSAPILPWGAPSEIAKISPVEASARLLAHMRDAWNAAHSDALASEQQIIITVPASFDEVARALTVQAAQEAGFKKFTLVEEPQAAFYDFTAHHQQELGELLKDVRLALVVDVGGGTTDFTLIQTGVSEGAPDLRRIAVGDHLMLGGDNMDAAVARHLEERLSTGGRKLSATQWSQLVQASREAKEALLSSEPPERHVVAIAAEGSRLVRGAVSAELKREEAEQLILDGFLPKCARNEIPRRAARTALQELGLPYAQDAAITRHLAGFLQRHAAAGFAALGQENRTGALPRPDAILLNGGVFKSARITERLLEALNGWWPGEPAVRLLPHGSLEYAVARGAVCHGLARHGLGARIGGGSAHALYIGLAPDKQNFARRAICLIPRGHEEGQPVELASQTFELTLGRPVQFPVFSAQFDRLDRPGEIVEVTDEFHALPPVHTLFQTDNAKTITSRPVHLRAVLTELGALELWCVANEGGAEWRLEFDVRGATSSVEGASMESAPARFAEARAAIERVFGKTASPAAPREVKQLWRTLETAIGPREHWGPPLLRELWSALFAASKGRVRSADHERVYFQLIGYTLRPGAGYPLDEWRSEQTFQLFTAGVQFHKEQPVWREFWVLWRRIAAGLNEARQKEIWDYLKPHLARRIQPDAPKFVGKTKGVQPDGLDEMARAAASLEHLEPAEKMLLGGWIAARLKTPATAAGPWSWALGRLGTRVPLYGSGHKTVDPDTVAEWLSLLLGAGLQSADGSAFAAAQMARMTGDRSRDLDDAIRARVVAELKAAQAPESWLRAVTEVVALQAADQARALGDTLPIGLRIRS